MWIDYGFLVVILRILDGFDCLDRYFILIEKYINFRGVMN